MIDFEGVATVVNDLLFDGVLLVVLPKMLGLRSCESWWAVFICCFGALPNDYNQHPGRDS